MATTSEVTTAEQLLSAPALGRCELLRGELVMMSPAGSEHGHVVVDITAPLAVFVKHNALGMVFGAETGFQIGRDAIRILGEADDLRGEDVVPGFEMAVREVFAS